MQNIRTEIDKLASFIPERAEITTADIEQLVTKNIENRVFEMIDDIAEGKNEAAIKKFQDLKTKKSLMRRVYCPFLKILP